ncbi:putative transmembrane protein [Toxoplasma gondii VEG]|uniref:Putative transmembrane protein n=3 Tax=Toxoplasma gondii TaxID=5811 RepID=B9QNA9_TOXGV|nr:putative transmembrane protein [Toxoplasma gondii VEG]CEL77035.1 TPA: hypothetical protein BN1205_031460 [Toxoplasma gondii VEG]
MRGSVLVVTRTVDCRLSRFQGKCYFRQWPVSGTTRSHRTRGWYLTLLLPLQSAVMAHVLISSPSTVELDEETQVFTSLQNAALIPRDRRKTRTHVRLRRSRSGGTGSWKPLATRVLIVTFLVALAGVALRRYVLRTRSRSMSTVSQDSDISASPRETVLDDRARFRADDGGNEGKFAFPSSPVENVAAAVARLNHGSTTADEQPHRGGQADAALELLRPPTPSWGNQEAPEGVTGRITEAVAMPLPAIDSLGERPHNGEQASAALEPPGPATSPWGNEETPEGATGRITEAVAMPLPAIDSLGERPHNGEQASAALEPPGPATSPWGNEETPEGATGRITEAVAMPLPANDSLGERPHNGEQASAALEPPGPATSPWGNEETPEGATGRITETVATSTVGSIAPAEQSHSGEQAGAVLEPPAAPKPWGILDAALEKVREEISKQQVQLHFAMRRGDSAEVDARKEMLLDLLKGRALLQSIPDEPGDGEIP